MPLSIESKGNFVATTQLHHQTHTNAALMPRMNPNAISTIATHPPPAAEELWASGVVIRRPRIHSMKNTYRSYRSRTANTDKIHFHNNDSDDSFHPLLPQIRSFTTLTLATVIEVNVHRLQSFTTIHALQLRYSIRSPLEVIPFTDSLVNNLSGIRGPSSVFTSSV